MTAKTEIDGSTYTCQPSNPQSREHDNPETDGLICLTPPWVLSVVGGKAGEQGLAGDPFRRGRFGGGEDEDFQRRELQGGDLAVREDD